MTMKWERNGLPRRKAPRHAAKKKILKKAGRQTS